MKQIVQAAHLLTSVVPAAGAWDILVMGDNGSLSLGSGAGRLAGVTEELNIPLYEMKILAR